MAKAPSPIRLQQNLMDAATLTGGRFHRSAAEQIEYWADLGQRIANYLDPDILMEVALGLARIKVERTIAEPVDSDIVFAALEARRKSGELSQAVTQAKIRYQASKTHPGYLEQIDVDGHRTVGKFHDGVFTLLPGKHA